jgi:predicted alpha/beta superfamily hydrolase
MWDVGERTATKQNYLPQVLLSDEFEIPQLNRTRKIWALLPHDYDDSEERYPVMYLQDAEFVQ